MKLLLQLSEAFNTGAATKVSDTVKRLVQREPISLSVFLESEAAVPVGKDPFPSE